MPVFADQSEEAGRALFRRRPPVPPRGASHGPRVTRYRARVEGRFQWASRASRATVRIDRKGTFSVRPYRSTKRVELPIARVAEMVYRRVVATEVLLAAAKRARTRKASRRQRR